jgi:hypothetical protein
VDALAGVFGQQGKIRRNQRPFVIRDVRGIRFTGSFHAQILGKYNA